MDNTLIRAADKQFVAVANVGQMVVLTIMSARGNIRNTVQMTKQEFAAMARLTGPR